MGILQDWRCLKIEITLNTNDVELLAKALNNASGSTFDGKKYKKSWTFTAETKRLYTVVTLHSKMPGLPHLLEHGHAKANGGRVKGRVHIKPVEEKLISQYEREVTAKL